VTIVGALTILAAVAIPLAVRRPGAAGFTASTLAIVLFTATLLVSLFPDALPSTTSGAFGLTLRAASSSSYTLTVMTVVAVIFLPIVLAYQAWTYWVFRHRLGRDDYEGPLTPIAVLEHRAHSAQGATPPVPPEVTPPSGVA
jgi:cytochrome d ubiquinol oxidase subunit II